MKLALINILSWNFHNWIKSTITSVFVGFDVIWSSWQILPTKTRNSVLIRRIHTNDFTTLKHSQKQAFKDTNYFAKYEWSTWSKTSVIKDTLSGLGQFLATETRLKIMKNGFYFTLNVLFVLNIFKFLSWLFGHAGKRLD